MGIDLKVSFTIYPEKGETYTVSSEAYWEGVDEIVVIEFIGSRITDRCISPDRCGQPTTLQSDKQIIFSR